MSVTTAEGGLTALGYALCAAAALVLLLAASFIHGKTTKTDRKMSASQLAFCAMAIALAFVTSYIRLFHLPYGGSVTLMSMLFICLIGNWYGTGVGVMTGLAFGILQFLQEPYVLNFFQVCCDYILAFAGLGLAGVFRNARHGLLKGYLLGIFARGAFHALGGYLFWMSYMPENFPKALTALYPIIYNFSFIAAEGVLTIIVISLPPVAKALKTVKEIATSSQ